LNICPEIVRQRLIVEGIHGVSTIEESNIRTLLSGLTSCLGMTPIADTLIFSPDAVSQLHHGVGGFQAWAESGCSLYTWRESRLFTLDIYSCKAFDKQPCISYINRELRPSQIDWRLI
jgi:S-adenosylmethionine decarboxylase